MDQLTAVLYDREIAQSEKIHLKQSQTLYSGHRVLRHNFALAVFVQRNIIRYGISCYYYSCGVYGSISYHTFNLHRRFYKAADLIIR